MQSYADNLCQKHVEDSPQNYLNLLSLYFVTCMSNNIVEINIINNYAGKNKIK